VIVQLVPAAIGLVHVLVTVNWVFETVPRKGEVRVTGLLPVLVTVNTQFPLFPMLSPLLIVVFAHKGCDADVWPSGTVPNGTVGFCRFMNRTLEFPESATYRFPFASTARPAGPLSPLKLIAKGRLGAPAKGTSRTELVALSETYTFPVASTATPFGTPMLVPPNSGALITTDNAEPGSRTPPGCRSPPPGGRRTISSKEFPVSATKMNPFKLIPMAPDVTVAGPIATATGFTKVVVEPGYCISGVAPPSCVLEGISTTAALPVSAT
jgi:hypothetical protein